MIFENPALFWLLLLIPILFVFYEYIHLKRKKQIARLGQASIIRNLMKEYNASRFWIKFSIITLAIALIIIALARPQFATETKVNANENSEIIFALDISNSMLAKSANTSFSRLEMAKNAILDLMKDIKNERLGLVVFAGQAVMQIPITHDYDAFDLILKSINPSYITAQGTAIADAVNLATDAFSPDQNSQKSIILISDGEDHEGDIDQAIQKAKSKGVVIYTVGIGSARGNPIMINGQALRDKNGNIVISKLNEAVLRKMAKQTGGIYVNFSNNSRALKQIYSKINKKSSSGKTKIAKYDEKYHYFIFPALILIILDFFILLRQNRWIAKINIFEKNNLLENKDK
jgi:Ca-activated chloride channel family protein